MKNENFCGKKIESDSHGCMLAFHPWKATGIVPVAGQGRPAHWDAGA